MSDTQQELLRKAWTEGRKGNLSALSEVKAWALREVWRSEGKGEWGLMKFVAERVTKIGGGHPQQDHWLGNSPWICSLGGLTLFV